MQAPIGEVARRSRKAKLQRAELDVARLMSQDDLVPGEVFLFRRKAIDLRRELEDDRFALVGRRQPTSAPCSARTRGHEVNLAPAECLGIKPQDLADFVQCYGAMIFNHFFRQHGFRELYQLTTRPKFRIHPCQ